MAQIAELNDAVLKEDDANYLYKKDEYTPEDEEEQAQESKPEKAEKSRPQPKNSAGVVQDGFEVPVFLEGEENVIKIN